LSKYNNEDGDERVSNAIKEMSHMTIFFNKVSSAQVKSIEMFPFIYFDGVNSVELDYDLETVTPDKGPSSNKSIVRYDLFMDPMVKNNNMEYRFKTLEKSIRDIFWKEVNIHVYINDELKYKS